MTNKFYFVLVRQTLTPSNGWHTEVKGTYKSATEARAELTNYVEYIKGEDSRSAFRELNPFDSTMIVRVGYIASGYTYPMGQFLILKIPAL